MNKFDDNQVSRNLRKLNSVRIQKDRKKKAI